MLFLPLRSSASLNYSLPACLYVSPFHFIFIYWKVCSSMLRSGDSLGHWRLSHSFALRSSWVAFAVCLSVMCCLICCIWVNVSRNYSPVHLRIHPATSGSSRLISKHLWGILCPSHNTASTMFGRWWAFLFLLWLPCSWVWPVFCWCCLVVNHLL